MSQVNVDSLRPFLEKWGEEPWTPEIVREGGVLETDLLDPDVTYEDTILPDHAGEAYRGHEGVLRATERWIEGSEWVLVELEEIVIAGDRLVSVHRVRSRARHTGIEFETPLAYIWTFRDGKIIHFESHLDPEQAVATARLRG